jgi:hypothetical protein
MVKRAAKFVLLLLAALADLPGMAQYVTLTGTVQSSNGLPAQDYTIALTLSQWGFVAGTGVQVPVSTFCATSTDGSVVGIGNPLSSTIVTPAFSGTLPAATYFVEYGFYVGSTVTLASPEMQVQLLSTGQIQVAPPVSGIPAGATGMNVYIGTSSGAETLQGQTTGSAVYTQSTPLTSGSSLPNTNTTGCKEIANDTIWPVGTGYSVTLSDSSGNTVPGYPMMWQLLGANSTINLSNGLPYYHGVVTYPAPILASPLNHATQSISGGLSFGNYNLLNVGMAGLGTSTPGWAVDAEGASNLGMINAAHGFLYGGAAPSGHLLLGNGTAYVDSATLPYSSLSGAPTLNYQTVDSNGTLMPQQGELSFDASFSLRNSLGPPGATIISLANTIPTVATPSAGHAACIKSAGPPVLIGYCSTQPDASGNCTCN